MTVTETSANRPRGRTRAIATAAVVLGALVVLLSLGTWQVERLFWKERLLEDIADRRHAPAVELSAVEAMHAAGEDIEYRPVTASGRFLNDGERHFFATFHGRSGYYIYTPLALADGRFVFVNRGFVPFENKDPATRAAGQLDGEQTVVGLARAELLEKPSSLVPDNDPAKNIFYWKDLGVMAETDGLDRAKVLPFFIDAGNAANPGGLPIGSVTQFDLPNNHLQYAITWYGLALALVAVVSAAWLRGRRKS